MQIPKNIELQYIIPDDLWFFSGHFPGNPVFPGIMLISLGIAKLKEKYPRVSEYRLSSIKYCRFKDIIKPNETIKLKYNVNFQQDNPDHLEINYMIEKFYNISLKASLFMSKGAGHD